MKTKQILLFIGCLVLPLAIGGISGFATASGVKSWFLTIQKPSFNPPNWLFAPVWTVLYTLMGISFFLIVRSPKTLWRQRSILIFLMQLTLNFLWSFLFFYFHEIGLALVDILLLWVLILMMIAYFKKVNPTAAYLQIPYIFWVSFASVLNASIWLLN